MSWTENICKKHDGFVHTGSNCIMCVEDAALQRGADAARRECAGMLADRAAIKSSWLTTAEKDILNQSAAAILERVGKEPAVE